MEFKISAESIEEADKVLNNIRKQMWKEAAAQFANSESDMQKAEIAQRAINRGITPFTTEDVTEVYHLMDKEAHPETEVAMPQKVSRSKCQEHVFDGGFVLQNA